MKFHNTISENGRGHAIWKGLFTELIMWISMAHLHRVISYSAGKMIKSSKQVIWLNRAKCTQLKIGAITANHVYNLISDSKIFHFPKFLLIVFSTLLWWSDKLPSNDDLFNVCFTTYNM